jgi:beta-galactosidase
MPVLATRLATHGGPVTAVQLDNEVGMLAWVSNSPDLTPQAIRELRSWVEVRRPDAADLYPLIDPAEETWTEAVRTPREQWAGALRVDLSGSCAGVLPTTSSTCGHALRRSG